MNNNNVATQIETNERILGRKLARELTTEELNLVSGGHDPKNGETCSGQDCDVQLQ